MKYIKESMKFHILQAKIRNIKKVSSIGIQLRYTNSLTYSGFMSLTGYSEEDKNNRRPYQGEQILAMYVLRNVLLQFLFLPTQWVKVVLCRLNRQALHTRLRSTSRCNLCHIYGYLFFFFFAMHFWAVYTLYGIGDSGLLPLFPCTASSTARGQLKERISQLGYSIFQHFYLGGMIESPGLDVYRPICMRITRRSNYGDPFSPLSVVLGQLVMKPLGHSVVDVVSIREGNFNIH